MLKECLEALDIKPNENYVDVTFGGGGHSNAILALLDKGKLVAFDQDEDAKANVPQNNKLVFIDQNFEFMLHHLDYQGLLPVSGILADLGVSSHQFDEAERGFSFRFDDAALDMRMNKDSGTSAATLLNEWPEAAIADVLYQYGELNNARALAREIVHYRSHTTIITVGHLKDAIKKYTPKFGDYKFLAQVFQALRIEVNQELEVLKSFLLQVPKVLKPGGRLVVMSYHSLEDRLVKNFIQAGNFNGEAEKDLYGNIQRPLQPVSRKVITASASELEANPRSRSAKLRIAEKISSN